MVALLIDFSYAVLWTTEIRSSVCVLHFFRCQVLIRAIDDRTFSFTWSLL